VDEWIVRLLMVVEPTLIVCVTALFGWWLKLRHERRMLAERGEEVARLREDLDLACQELHERLDFVERSLAQGRASPLIEPETPTPA
jgi:hypothetical protein